MLEQWQSNQICGAWSDAGYEANRAASSFGDTASEWRRPSVIMRPRLSIDGNQWCALYGANLMEGLAAFGDSPAAAMTEFDRAWYAKLAAR